MSLGQWALRTGSKPLPLLASSLGAVGLTELYLDYGWLPPVGAVFIFTLLVAGMFTFGRLNFHDHPRRAALFIESALVFPLIVAAVAGAVLIILAVQFKPGPFAPGRDQEISAAVLAALTKFLEGAIIKPEGETWNPLKNAIKKDFGNDFKSPRTKAEQDARDAVGNNLGYTSHTGQTVDGWDWWARRLRIRHLAAAAASGHVAEPSIAERPDAEANA